MTANRSSQKRSRGTVHVVEQALFAAMLGGVLVMALGFGAQLAGLAGGWGSAEALAKTAAPVVTAGPQG